MLKKYLLVFAILGSLLYANEEAPKDEEVQTEQEFQVSENKCDAGYDTCYTVCEKKDSENTACFSQCETEFQECIKKEESN